MVHTQALKWILQSVYLLQVLGGNMKKGLIAFIVICIIICAIPLVGMTVRPTTESTENRALSDFPALRTQEGTLNVSFFQEFENYFSEHFAFRNELVYADAVVQSKLFGVSSTDRVIVGKNGWLYYTSTVDDYLGTDRLSEREIYNMAHNLALVKKYLDEKGIDFVITIPPNKNTLYGSNMPYYASDVVDPTPEMEVLAQILESNDIPYADLLKLFRTQSDTLYLKRDSHWDNRGALLAYNAILDEAGYKHDDFSGVEVTRAIDEVGDLNKMLYTFYGEKEANYRYSLPDTYDYLSDFTSVEDSWIETENQEGKKRLLMFRDSFGNTLIPFMANQFKNARFSKGQPYSLEPLIEEKKPDLVVFERVERSMDDFMDMPPIISSPRTVWPYGLSPDFEGDEAVETETTVSVCNMPFNSKYYEISGIIDEEYIRENSDIIVVVNSVMYDAYHTGENGYAIYAKKYGALEFPMEINIVVITDGEIQLVHKSTIEQLSAE